MGAFSGVNCLNMDTLDTALRLMVIGQIVLISMVLAARGPRSVSIPHMFLPRKRNDGIMRMIVMIGHQMIGT
jgi:hypothetical protein